MEVLVCCKFCYFIYMGWQNLASTEHLYKRTQSCSCAKVLPLILFFDCVTLASSCWVWVVSAHSRGNLRHIVRIALYIVHSLLSYIKDPGQRTVAKIIANPATPPVPGTPLLANHTAKMQNCNATPKPLTTCTCTDTIWPSVILCPT